MNEFTRNSEDFVFSPSISPQVWGGILMDKLPRDGTDSVPFYILYAEMPGYGSYLNLFLNNSLFVIWDIIVKYCRLDRHSYVLLSFLIYTVLYVSDQRLSIC